MRKILPLFALVTLLSVSAAQAAFSLEVKLNGILLHDEVAGEDFSLGVPDVFTNPGVAVPNLNVTTFATNPTNRVGSIFQVDLSGVAGVYTVEISGINFDLSGTGPAIIVGGTAIKAGFATTALDNYLDPGNTHFSVTGLTHPTIIDDGTSGALFPWVPDTTNAIYSSAVVVASGLFSFTATGTATVLPIPEPNSLILTSFGLLGLLIFRRKRK